jgi:hypothetical protein
MEKAGEHLEKFLKERPEIKTLTNYRTVAPTIAEEFLIEGLRKAGMPD